jgi:uncharacterized protein YraI
MAHIGKTVVTRLAVLIGVAWFALSVFAVVHLADKSGPAPQSAYSACLAYVNGHGMTTDICGPLSPTATSPTAADTSEFNAGFADSKQDDCQQGDAQACAWLRGN